MGCLISCKTFETFNILPVESAEASSRYKYAALFIWIFPLQACCYKELSECCTAFGMTCRDLGTERMPYQIRPSVQPAQYPTFGRREL